MRLDVRFHQSDQRLDVKFAASSERFSPGFGEVQRVTILAVDKYEGDYDVIPKAASQTLETKEKFMLDDVRIKAIPFFEVSNNSGGNTVYIGTLED